MKNRAKAAIGLAFSVVLFAFVVIISRFMVADVPQMYVLLCRTFVASIAFLPFFIRSRVWKKPQFGRLVLISFLSTLNLVFFIFGIKYTSASASQLIYAAQPMLTIIILSYYVKQKYSAKTVFGVFIGFLGIIFIIYSSAVEKGETIVGGLGGNLAIFIAMFCWLSYILLSKKLSQVFSVLEIGSTSLLISFLVSFVLSLFQFYAGGKALILSKNLILSGLYLGFFGSFMTYILLQFAIKHLSALTVNLNSYVQPILTTILAIKLLGEKMTPSFIIGSALVLTGVFISATLELLYPGKNTRI